MLTIKMGKIVGKSGGRLWGQVYVFGRKEGYEDKGELVVVGSLEQEEEWEQVKMAEVGRELFLRISELYFQNEKTGLTALRETVEKVKEECSEAEILAIAFRGTKVDVVSSGQGGAWVRIKEKEGWIISPTENQENKLIALEGELAEGEVVVAGNKRFWKRLPMGMLRAAVENSGQEWERAVEILAAVERAEEGRGGEVGVLIRLVTAAEEEKEEEVGGEVPEETEKETKEAPVRFGGKEQSQPWQGMINRLNQLVPKPRVYVDNEEKIRARKRMAYAGIGFLVVLLVLMGGGSVLRRQKQVKQAAEVEQLNQLSAKFDEAMAMVALNPSRSVELVGEMTPMVEAWKSKQSNEEKWIKIQNGWEDLKRAVAGVSLVEMEEVVDLGLVREGMTGTRIAGDMTTIWVLDGVGSRLVKIDPGKKSAAVVAAAETLGKAQELTLKAGVPVVWSEDKGIVQIKGNGATRLAKADGDLKEIRGMGVFGDNVYVLDANAGQIWKYTAGSEKKSKWLTTEGEVKGGTAMAIDGSVWVSLTGGMGKFTRGEKDEWQISGLDKAWGSGAGVYTNSDSSSVYVLDPENQRVIQLGKDGTFQHQWHNAAMGKATGLTVDEGRKAAYIIAENKVWKLGI